MATLIHAGQLRAGDLINLGGRDRVAAIRCEGALPVVLFDRLGSWLKIPADTPVTLVERKCPKTVTGAPGIVGDSRRRSVEAAAGIRSGAGGYLDKGGAQISPSVTDSLRRCEGCEAPLLAAGRANRRYCGDACRQRACRERRVPGEKRAA